MPKKPNNEYLTTETVYARLRECLEAVAPSDKKLSGAMRDRLDYNIHFLRCFIELQGDKGTDIQAIGFEIDSERDYEDDDTDGETSAE